MDGKVLGKISHTDVYTEYDHLYFRVDFSGDGWGVGNTYPLIPGPKAKDPEKWKIFPLAQYMKAANVDRVSKLQGVPVEVEFDRNILKSWRILTEVI